MDEGKEESREREEGGVRKVKRQGHEEREQEKHCAVPFILYLLENARSKKRKDRLVGCVGHDSNFRDITVVGIISITCVEVVRSQRHDRGQIVGSRVLDTVP